MNYEEFKKNYKGTAKNIMNYGDSIRVFHLIIGIIILVSGIISSLMALDKSGGMFVYMLIGTFIVSITIISIGEFIKHLLYGLAEIVINTEISARNSCGSAENAGIAPSKNELPEL